MRFASGINKLNASEVCKMHLENKCTQVWCTPFNPHSNCIFWQGVRQELGQFQSSKRNMNFGTGGYLYH